jgi:hypothetical protein
MQVYEKSIGGYIYQYCSKACAEEDFTTCSNCGETEVSKQDCANEAFDCCQQYLGGNPQYYCSERCKGEDQTAFIRSLPCEKSKQENPFKITPLHIDYVVNAQSASPCTFITAPEGGVLNVQRCKTRVKTSMQIGSHYYNLNEDYYVAGDIGENPSNYPRLSSFSDAHISSKTGLSVKYPKYHFDFKLVQYNNFDSGMASIYKLVITITI